MDNEYFEALTPISDPLLIRKTESQYLLSILNRQGARRRAVIIGRRGSGRSTLIAEVIRRLTNSQIPESLKQLKPYRIDIAAVLVRVTGQKSFQDLPPIQRDRLLIIENLDEFFTIGAVLTEAKAAQHFLSSWVLSGDHPILTIMTPEIYQHHLSYNSLWQKNLSPFYFREMMIREIRRILSLWQKKYEQNYELSIPDRVLDEIMELGHSLLTDTAFPLCGIELLEAVCSSAIIRLSEEEETTERSVNSDDLYSHMSQLLRIPVGNYLGIEERRVLQLRNRLSTEIFGQEKAINALVRAVQRALLGTKEPGHAHPLGVFLFMGPTGVGKTETARALSRHLFGEDQSILLNMAEFQDPIEGIKRLQGGALAEPVSKNPFSVVVLDEIEKSSQRIREFFLNVFDYGVIKDIHERDIDASKTFFIMTSNVGSDLFEQSHGILPEAFSEQDYKIKKTELLETLKKEQFRPEFINRVDDLLLFKPLSRDDIAQIIEANLNMYSKLILAKEEKQVEIDPGIPQILAKGCDLNFGARDARRIIRKNIYSHILKTEQYYQAKNIKIVRSESLRAMDYVNIMICSLNPKDGISLVLDLNMDKFNIDVTRIQDLRDFSKTMNMKKFDIILLHSSLATEGTQRSALDQTLSYMKKIDHRALLYLVVDALQPLAKFKAYITQGVGGLIRVSEIDDWLVDVVGEVQQRQRIVQTVEYNYEEMEWHIKFSRKEKTLTITLTSLG
ncbi:AAA family ATPase [candidate division CSSED10-310 bacterium]|uniref:AAA family ATPase n=1 Tax=candidate division CSSED10-310 bacterium TaxID=2855610 RepID=A0ABV6YYX1_UNCC1